MEHTCDQLEDGCKFIYDQETKDWVFRIDHCCYVDVKYCPFCGERLVK